MNKILCSTGALIGRPNGRDYRLLKEFCPKLNCDGFELMVYPDWYGEKAELIRFLKPLKINIPVLHCEKALAEHITRGGEEELAEAFRLFGINCDIASSLGADRMVLHLWNGVISDSRFENNLRAYGDLRKTAAEYGLDLHCSMILQEYRENLPMYNRLRQIVLKQLEGCLKRSHLVVSGLEARVKQEESLAGKLDSVSWWKSKHPRLANVAASAITISNPGRSCWWCRSATCRFITSAGFPSRSIPTRSSPA